VFSGVPTFIKDTDDVEGLPTSLGSRATPRVAATASSMVVQQLDSLGMVTLGKSTTPEFGLTATTESTLMGATTNPWNINHSSGGSSGGSAALVASGVVPIAHGNDGGGSIRMPASCCGLVGLKPSRGRLVDPPEAEKAPVNLTTAGVLSRSVRDTAAFYAAAEQYYRNPALPEVGVVEHPGEKRLKMGVFINRADGTPSDLDCAAVTLDAAKVCDRLGHSVEAIDCPFPQRIVDDFFHYWSFMVFAIYRFGKKFMDDDFQKEKAEAWMKGLSKRFVRNILRSPFSLSRLRRFQQDYEDIFKTYDILISPTTATVAPELGHIAPDGPFEIVYERVLEFVAFTPIQNVSGAPAISLPMGKSKNGLPVGVQFASAIGNERQLLELALELEEAHPWPEMKTAEDFNV